MTHQIQKKESENGKMKIVDLYYDRCHTRLISDMKEIIDETYKTNEYIKRYNEIVNTCITSLAELVNESVEASEIIKKSGYRFNSGYEINYDKIDVSEIERDYGNILDASHKCKEEVEALLEISNDKDYVLKVLKEYGIVNKDCRVEDIDGKL